MTFGKAGAGLDEQGDRNGYALFLLPRAMSQAAVLARP